MHMLESALTSLDAGTDVRADSSMCIIPDSQILSKG
jgi:hypothetical protein